jgi:hypothetical protein
MRYFLTLIQVGSGVSTRIDLSFLPAVGTVIVVGDVAYVVVKIVVQVVGSEETGVHHSLDVYVEKSTEAVVKAGKRVSVAEFNG